MVRQGGHFLQWANMDHPLAKNCQRSPNHFVLLGCRYSDNCWQQMQLLWQFFLYSIKEYHVFMSIYVKTVSRYSQYF